MIQTSLNDEFWESICITEEEDSASWNCKVHEPVMIASNPHDNGLITRGNISLGKNAGSPVFLVDNTMLHLVRRDDIPNHCGMGRIIRDLAWIDLYVIKDFLDNCTLRHGDRWKKFPFDEDVAHIAQPLFLITGIVIQLTACQVANRGVVGGVGGSHLEAMTRRHDARHEPRVGLYSLRHAVGVVKFYLKLCLEL